MSWVLVCHGLAWAESTEIEGYFLASFDVDAHDGRGTADWVSNPELAMRFDGFREAMEAWRTQSTVRPLRDDGKPNRPLTAFTVEPRALAD